MACLAMRRFQIHKGIQEPREAGNDDDKSGRDNIKRYLAVLIPELIFYQNDRTFFRMRSYIFAFEHFFTRKILQVMPPQDGEVSSCNWQVRRR
jgi:hypothetical protein